MTWPRAAAGVLISPGFVVAVLAFPIVPWAVWQLLGWIGLR